MPESEVQLIPFVGSEEDPYRGFEFDDTPETTDVSTAVSAAIKVDPEKWHEEMAQLFDPNS
ncbi:hypothetical protein KKC44_02375 [Patescibacteria group bacterium]|nr:hypothetical protein [Patescibacteria group bacterium]